MQYLYVITCFVMPFKALLFFAQVFVVSNFPFFESVIWCNERTFECPFKCCHHFLRPGRPVWPNFGISKSPISFNNFGTADITVKEPFFEVAPKAIFCKKLCRHEFSQIWSHWPGRKSQRQRGSVSRLVALILAHLVPLDQALLVSTAEIIKVGLKRVTCSSLSLSLSFIIFVFLIQHFK